MLICSTGFRVGLLVVSVDIENAIDSALNRFRTALDETYGKRIERVVLFGARVAMHVRIRITMWPYF